MLQASLTHVRQKEETCEQLNLPLWAYFKVQKVKTYVWILDAAAPEETVMLAF